MAELRVFVGSERADRPNPIWYTIRLMGPEPVGGGICVRGCWSWRFSDGRYRWVDDFNPQFPVR